MLNENVILICVFSFGRLSLSYTKMYSHYHLEISTVGCPVSQPAYKLCPFALCIHELLFIIFAGQRETFGNKKCDSKWLTRPAGPKEMPLLSLKKSPLENQTLSFCFVLFFFSHPPSSWRAVLLSRTETSQRQKRYIFNALVLFKCNYIVFEYNRIMSLRQRETSPYVK